jgi:hypothetical protein
MWIMHTIDAHYSFSFRRRFLFLNSITICTNINGLIVVREFDKSNRNKNETDNTTIFVDWVNVEDVVCRGCRDSGEDYYEGKRRCKNSIAVPDDDGKVVA